MTSRPRGGRKVVGGVGPLGNGCHPLAAPPLMDVGTHGVDDAPAFVSRRAGSERVLEPRFALERFQVGGTHPATFQPEAHLPGGRFRQRQLLDDDLARLTKNGGTHVELGSEKSERGSRRQV